MVLQKLFPIIIYSGPNFHCIFFPLLCVRRGQRRQRDGGTGLSPNNFFIVTDIYGMTVTAYRYYDKDVSFQKLLNLVEK